MNKLKITLLSLVASAFLTVTSFAGVTVGISAGLAGLEVSGTETLKDSSAVTTHTEQANAVIPSIFLEVAHSNGLGVGVDFITGTADLSGSTQQTTMTDLGNGGGEGNDSGTNSANAEVDGIVTGYLIKSFESGLFVKLGMASADVNTKETLATGSTYGNTSVDGVHYGLGFQRTNDSGLFIRAAAEYTDFDNITLTGTAAGGTSTSFNKISADVDVAMAKFSVGKAF